MTDRMKTETRYVFEEVHFLLSLGESPVQIAKALNRKPSTIYKAALRHGETRIAEIFNEEIQFVAKVGWQQYVARRTRIRKVGAV